MCQHLWSDGYYSSLMTCVRCGRSRSTPTHVYRDRQGYVRPDSDEIYARKQEERARVEAMEKRERLQQLKEDLKELGNGETTKTDE